MATNDPESGEYRHTPDGEELSVPVHQVERKLAAIFAADFAGYSRLVARDNVGTLARLEALAEPGAVCISGAARNLHDWSGALANRSPNCAQVMKGSISSGAMLDHRATRVR